MNINRILNFIPLHIISLFREWKKYGYYTLLLILLLGHINNSSAQSIQEAKNPQQVAPLHLGLLPHLSSNLLLKKYQKLIRYLEERLQRRVVVHTAPNFKIYIQRVIEGRYDLYLTAPHLAAYHESEQGHQRIAVFGNTLRGLIVVTKDSSYTQLSDLQGKVFYTPDKLAVISLLGEVTLQDNNIDLTINHSSSHNNAMHAVASGKADAAIVGDAAYRITLNNKKLKKPLRVLTKTESIPSMMFMTPGRTSDQERETFTRTLLSIENYALGRDFIESVPFDKFKPITDLHMQRLANMVTLLKQRLNK